MAVEDNSVHKKDKKKDIKKKMEDEQDRITKAVANLTIDAEKKVDHKSVLEDAARRLNEARLKSLDVKEAHIGDDLKTKINACETDKDLSKLLWAQPGFQSRFSSLFSSKLLEQILSFGSLQANPLKTFPIDINTNLYADIANFALDHAPDFILLLLSLTKKMETPVSAKDVIELSFSFASLAESCSSQNKALKKIKSICMKTNGMTNAGLDHEAASGAAESSRSFRNDRDLVASFQEEIVKNYAKSGTAQFTFDNLDIRINNIQHHLTLNFLEFEQADTSEFNTDSKSLEEMLGFFCLESVLLRSESNQEMFRHFQFLTAHSLGRLLGGEIPGMEWLKSVHPKHYEHLNSSTSSNKSLMHVDKPMYLQETKNSEMFRIMNNLQLEYLNMIGEQADDKVKYFEDLRKILSVECDKETREASEMRIKEQEKKSGVFIAHGDQLTAERFESCKRLKQGSASAFERYEFMQIFRVGMFHLRKDFNEEQILTASS